MQRENVCYIFVGNPGAGKSTFLNSLVGQAVFHSGISIGSGLTTITQVYQHSDGNRYIDTPGLSDILHRQQAADEITKALKQGGLYRIFFFITLEDGRIRGEDKATMKLVLNAASCIQNSYSVIINKVSTRLKQHIVKDAHWKEFKTLMNAELSGTGSFFLYEFNANLESVNDAVTVLSDEFLYFIQTAPSVTIPQSDVKKIEANEYEELKKELTEKMRLKEKEMSERIKEKDQQIANLEYRTNQLHTTVFTLKQENQIVRADFNNHKKSMNAQLFKIKELEGNVQRSNERAQREQEKIKKKDQQIANLEYRTNQLNTTVNTLNQENQKIRVDFENQKKSIDAQLFKIKKLEGNVQRSNERAQSAEERVSKRLNTG